MKHLELFESWHHATVCSHCKGTGYVGQSKKQSIANIIKNGTEEHFLEFIDDEDFVENAVDLFKEQGVYNFRTAKMLAALNLSRAEMQDIIDVTMDNIDTIEGVLGTNLGKDIAGKELKKMEEIVKNKAEILAILRK